MLLLPVKKYNFAMHGPCMAHVNIFHGYLRQLKKFKKILNEIIKSNRQFNLTHSDVFFSPHHFEVNICFHL